RRRVVRHDRWPLPAEDPLQPPPANVAPVEPGGAVDMPPLARGQVVDDHDFIAFLDEPVHDVRPDEARPARYQNLHFHKAVPPDPVADRYHWTKAAMPSLIVVRGAKPRRLMAFSMSAKVTSMSPACMGCHSMRVG